MKITFLTTKPPTLSSGAEVRNFYILKALLESPDIDAINLIYVRTGALASDIEVSHKKLFTQVFSLPKRTIWDSIQSYISGEIPYVSFLKRNNFGTQVVKIINSSDLLLISELDGFFLISNSFRSIDPRVKTILDCHNVDSVRFSSELLTSSLPKRIAAIPIRNSLEKDEIHAIKSVDRIFCCSLKDKEYFSNFKNAELIDVVPNGVDYSKHQTRLGKDIDSNKILFMGELSYGPNDDALKYYFSEIHPNLLSQEPSLVITILGRNPPGWLHKIARKDKSVELMGFVNNKEDYLSEAIVCICPIRYGSGTRLKVLEYMLASKPVVSTTVGAEGINVTNTKDIFISDSAENFTKAILNLFRNRTLRLKIGRNARELMRKEYNWQEIGNNCVNIINNEVKKS